MINREENYDYLRCISCIAIVLLHISSSYWGVIETKSIEFIIMTIYNGITRFAVPVFMMLSGAFLLDIKKNISIKQSLKRFGKCIFNFYLWSAFYAFQGIIMKILTGDDVTQILWTNSLERFLWGHYHMWFIFLILGFYLILPIARKIAESKTVLEYYLILWVFTRFILPVGCFNEKFNLINIWIGKLDINLLIGYLGYFLLGYYIREYGFLKKIRIVIYAGGMIGFIYSIIVTIKQSFILGMCYENYFNPSSWNILLFSVAIFTLFSYMKKVDVSYSLVKKIAGCSFIIYILHPFFIEKLNLIGITTISFNCLWSIPILTIVVFLCSFLVAYIIKSIPYLNKIII